MRSNRAEHASPPTLWRPLPLLAAAVLAFSLFLGGAGDAYPLITLAIELADVALLACLVAIGRPPRSPGTGLLPGLIAGGAIALPLLQLIPLPPDLWRALPGREAAQHLLELGGLADRWRPMSLNPGATVATALEMLPGLAMFLCVPRLEPRHRLLLIGVAIAVGLSSALLGTLQKAGGDLSPFILFDTPHRGNSPGLFVNRNHQATFLLVSMLLAAGALRALAETEAAARGLLRALGAALVLVFAAGVVVTTSRTGFLLLVPAVAASLLILFPVRWNWKFAAAAFVLVAGFAGLASQSSAVQSTLERFSDTDDHRRLYWKDSIEAIHRTWPTGSGLGTFPEVHAAAQDLDSVGIQFVNNAHNDYLELVLEGGALAAALIALGLLYLALTGFRLTRSDRPAVIATAALAAIIVILVHSIFDYPLRMLSMMTLFGLLWGLVAAGASPVGEDE